MRAPSQARAMHRRHGARASMVLPAEDVSRHSHLARSASSMTSADGADHFGATQRIAVEGLLAIGAVTRHSSAARSRSGARDFDAEGAGVVVGADFSHVA